MDGLPPVSERRYDLIGLNEKGVETFRDRNLTRDKLESLLSEYEKFVEDHPKVKAGFKVVLVVRREIVLPYLWADGD